MSTPWSRAHENLVAQLQDRVRIHRQREPRELTRVERADKFAARRRPVEVKGKVYKTFTSAYRALRISPYTLRGWLASGKAMQVQSKR